MILKMIITKLIILTIFIYATLVALITLYCVAITIIFKTFSSLWRGTVTRSNNSQFLALCQLLVSSNLIT